MTVKISFRKIREKRKSDAGWIAGLLCEAELDFKSVSKLAT